MLTAVLIDDEYYALEGLKMELEELRTVKVIGMYEEGQEALENVKVLKPDVVFLDINMSETNGLDLFAELTENSPQLQIVFVTAYKEYAVEAFELDAADYIVKPVRKERLKKTIARLQKNALLSGGNHSFAIHCLGRLSIRINGKEADIAWRTKKAEEMIAFLACKEGEFVAKEKIAEALWPELDEDKSKANFYLTYHYLKKQFIQTGFEVPLESVRGKMRFKIEEVELDLIKFKTELQNLQEISEDNIHRAEQATQLYREMLLDEHYYDWSTELAQFFEILYKEFLQKIIEFYKRKRNIEKQYYYEKKLCN